MTAVIASPAKPGVAIHVRWIVSTFAEAPADTVVALVLAMTDWEFPKRKRRGFPKNFEIPSGWFIV